MITLENICNDYPHYSHEGHLTLFKIRQEHEAITPEMTSHAWSILSDSNKEYYKVAIASTVKDYKDAYRIITALHNDQYGLRD